MELVYQFVLACETDPSKIQEDGAGCGQMPLVQQRTLLTGLLAGAKEPVELLASGLVTIPFPGKLKIP
jgi:hypothetical protein